LKFLRFNFAIVINVIGILIAISGGLQLVSFAIGYLFDKILLLPMLWAALSTMLTGLLLWAVTFKTNRNIKKKEGYLIVTLGWLALCIFGTLPFLFTGYITNVSDAFFETVSGFTATGATILTHIEGLPCALLFWRSLMAWIGGMGIVVLTVAILPILGIGGVKLFTAEAPGLSAEKVHPRIKETAKRIWFIYLLFTFIEFFLLKIAGLSWFDALNHAMTSIATSGFSTKDASIAAFDTALVQYIIIIFMFLGGTNFVLIYFAFKGNFKRVFKNEEFRFYVSIITIFSLITFITILFTTSAGYEKAFRDALFQVISIITTTGYITADYTSWASLTTVLFFVMFFLGACAGSTSGGAKLIRHLLLGKNILSEFKRQLHQHAIIPVRYGGKAVNPKIISNITSFIIVYILFFILGALILSLLGENFESALGASAACLGNVGPAIGKAGPVSNFSEIHWIGKWLLSFFMLLGRLELYTILLLFTPYFWQK